MFSKVIQKCIGIVHSEVREQNEQDFDIHPRILYDGQVMNRDSSDKNELF